MDYKISNKTIDKLKYDLVREGLLDYNQLVDAIELAKDQQTNLGQVLIQSNIITEGVLLNFLEQKLHIPYVNLEDYSVDTVSIRLISEEEAKKYKILPLFIIEDTLTIAMADPLDLFVLNNLNISSRYKVEPVICSERSILNTIDNLYKPFDVELELDSDTNSMISSKTETTSKFNWQSELSEDKTDEVNIYRLVRAIIYQATQENVSDIHLDPQKNELKVRFRIDGLLYNRGSLPVLIAPSFISRIKSASGLDLNEQFLPQHGRMEVNIDKNILNAMVSTYPTSFGEKIVIKIFSKAPNLNTLGFEPEQLEVFKHALNMQSGIILAASSSGIGQTTTMYSALEYITSENKNIMTIEMPIHYNIDNINQSQINISKNFDVNTALKALLLQEPDIIYIDEISNLSDIELVVKSAIANKLIFSSLTADSAVRVLYRLISSGVDLKLIAATLNVIICQKLVRVLCPKCKLETTEDSQLVKKFKLPDNVTYFKANGCNYCNNTGYKGRTGVFEIFSIDENTKTHLLQAVPETEFSAFLKDSGYKTLFDTALIKVQQGITSFDEVLRIFKL